MNLTKDIVLSELAKLKSKLSINVSVRTNPNNPEINSLILGIISNGVGGVNKSSSNLDAENGITMYYKDFNKMYINLIMPSISDKGSVSINLNNSMACIVFGNCNNISRAFIKGFTMFDTLGVSIRIDVKVDMRKIKRQHWNAILRLISNDIGL